MSGASTSQSRELPWRSLVILVTLGGLRIAWGAFVTQRAARVSVDLILDIAIIVYSVILFRWLRQVRPVLDDGGTRTLDSRHAGVAMIGAGSVGSGLAAAKAPLLIVLIASMVGAVFFGLLGLKSVPPWQDTKHGPWVGGAMFMALGVIALAVGFGVRLAT